MWSNVPPKRGTSQRVHHSETARGLGEWPGASDRNVPPVGVVLVHGTVGAEVLGLVYFGVYAWPVVQETMCHTRGWVGSEMLSTTLPPTPNKLLPKLYRHLLGDVLHTRVNLELAGSASPVNVALDELVDGRKHVVDLANVLRGGVALADGDSAVLDSCACVSNMFLSSALWVNHITTTRQYSCTWRDVTHADR